jgi:hypothetical protein
MVWTSPRTWVAGEKPSAATLNEHIRDNFKAIGDPWTSYTSTLGNWTQGNGTLAAAYIEAGKLIHFRIKLTFGTTTVAGGSPTFTAPFAGTAVRAPVLVQMWDASAASAAAHKGGFAFFSSTTDILIRDSSSAVLSATNPFTWTTSDELIVSGTYERA